MVGTKVPITFCYKIEPNIWICFSNITVWQSPSKSL
nr:MAG TPA: hypothetical protein [Caudoviricetes sp.]